MPIIHIRWMQRAAKVAYHTQLASGFGQLRLPWNFCLIPRLGLNLTLLIHVASILLMLQQLCIATLFSAPIFLRSICLGEFVHRSEILHEHGLYLIVRGRVGTVQV